MLGENQFLHKSGLLYLVLNIDNALNRLDMTCTYSILVNRTVKSVPQAEESTIAVHVFSAMSRKMNSCEIKSMFFTAK